MHPEFVSILSCPETRGPLELQITETYENGTVKGGYLITRDAAISYPIIEGVPRFVDEELYSDSFGYEWGKWSRVQFENENTGGPMEGHTSQMFYRSTQFTPQDLAGISVVEFGCGGGRFLDVVRRAGGFAVGIDMSSAVDAAQTNLRGDPKVLIVQGDVLNPPFKDNIFDLGFSIGVFHHTPNPEEGFSSMVRTVKPGGRVACSVYPAHGFYAFRSVGRYRKAHARLKSLLGVRAARQIATTYAKMSASFLQPSLMQLRHIPVLGPRLGRYIERNLLVTLHLPDVRWRVLDIFDAITPTFASTHTPDEVVGWFLRSGCVDILHTQEGGTSFVATKGSGA